MARMASPSRVYPSSPARQFAPARSPQDRHSGRSAHGPVSILIVEDDFLAAMEIESVLKEAGYQIVGVAAHADEAVRLAKSATPTLVIMDIRLAGNSDGVAAALDIFRATGVRSIFATAHHDAHTRSRAQAATPLGWLPKPYAPHALLALVKKTVGGL
jgi:DNA-binding NarL/FixJ family response regulator